jgi:hypothetical protein
LVTPFTGSSASTALSADRIHFEPDISISEYFADPVPQADGGFMLAERFNRRIAAKT